MHPSTSHSNSSKCNSHTQTSSVVFSRPLISTNRNTQNSDHRATRRISGYPPPYFNPDGEQSESVYLFQMSDGSGHTWNVQDFEGMRAGHTNRELMDEAQLHEFKRNLPEILRLHVRELERLESAYLYDDDNGEDGDDNRQEREEQKKKEEGGRADSTTRTADTADIATIQAMLLEADRSELLRMARNLVFRQKRIGEAYRVWRRFLNVAPRATPSNSPYIVTISSSHHLDSAGATDQEDERQPTEYAEITEFNNDAENAGEDAASVSEVTRRRARPQPPIPDASPAIAPTMPATRAALDVPGEDSLLLSCRQLKNALYDICSNAFDCLPHFS